jgi:hypothetical protein
MSLAHLFPEPAKRIAFVQPQAAGANQCGMLVHAGSFKRQNAPSWAPERHQPVTEENMANEIASRQIAEHLCTLASLLEAEAIRVNTLGIFTRKNLAQEAGAVRALATRLWEADVEIDLRSAEKTGAALGGLALVG